MRCLRVHTSNVVLEDKVLVSKLLKDKKYSLGLELGLGRMSLDLKLGLELKVLSNFKTFLSLYKYTSYQ